MSLSTPFSRHARHLACALALGLATSAAGAAGEHAKLAREPAHALSKRPEQDKVHLLVGDDTHSPGRVKVAAVHAAAPRHSAKAPAHGKGFAMVAHLVHKKEAGQLAVVAVLMDVASNHHFVQTVWTRMPLDTSDRVPLPDEPLDLNELRPTDQRHHPFMGSLTTPPCTEGVLCMGGRCARRSEAVCRMRLSPCAAPQMLARNETDGFAPRARSQPRR